MKRWTIILVLSILITDLGHSSRLITSLDIANWYLDSDMVIVCTINQIDTILVSHHDTLLDKDKLLHYDIICEKYHITIDSIIKQEKSNTSGLDIIISQDFVINNRVTSRNKGKIYTIESNGDTTFYIMDISTDFLDFSDNSYFRPMLDSSHVVILSETKNGYMIDYETVCSESILKLIREIKIKGHSYFDEFKKQ
jgi:hypothetical protein